jgi:hypothetical protein
MLGGVARRPGHGEPSMNARPIWLDSVFDGKIKKAQSCDWARDQHHDSDRSRTEETRLCDEDVEQLPLLQEDRKRPLRQAQERMCH